MEQAQESDTSTPTPGFRCAGVAIGEVLGLRDAKLDRFGYFRVAINNETGQKLEFEMSSHGDRAAEPGSDTWLLRNRYATVTALGPITSTDDALPRDLATIWAHEGAST